MTKTPFPVSQDEIIAQVQEEKKLWWDFINNKRELFRERLELYNNIADQDHKIYVRLIRSVMQALMWLYYTDQMTVTFTWRQLWDDEYADNLNNLAEFDQEEMELEKLNYDVQWNRLFYWVWIRVFDHWDNFKKVPVFRSVDPLSWIPDPLWYIDNHRFYWFELEINDNDLTWDVYFNLDKLAPSTAESEDRRRDIVDPMRWFNDNWEQVESNPVYWIYNHYTTIKWKKYLITLAKDESVIVRFEEIEAVYNEEKESGAEIDFPIVLNYYEPFKWDPFWISIPDLLEDKQKSEQLFLNLNRIKAEHEAWGDTFLVDTNAVKNLNDLRQHTFWPKYIRANLSQNPNPIRPVDRGNIKSDAFNMPNVIKQQASSDIWLDERSLWISPNSSLSATENQRVQKNANIKLLLNSKINQWWEKAFWRLWLRSYFEFFKFKDEKNIKLQNAFGNVITTLKREDIDTWFNIDIKIISKTEESEVREKDKIALLTIADLVLQDQASPNISKTFAKRQIAKANWLDKEKISVLFPASAEEAQAKLDLELLNRDMDVWEIDNLQEDHLTYLVVYQKAMDTEAKRKAISDRQQAYTLSWQAQAPRLPEEWVKWVGWITAQAASQSIAAWQEQWAASLQDI